MAPIDLLCGWPNPALLPAPELCRSASTVLSTPAIAYPGLLYGPDEGYGPLRAHIAQWLSTFYQPQDPISSERICITGGASQNLACVLQVFTDPIYTRNVWMVAPTYHLAARIMDDAGFAGKLRGVPEDQEGVDVAFLEKGLRAAEDKAQEEGNTEPRLKSPQPWRKVYKHVIYAVPTFSNPSSKVMSLHRREQLIRLARQYDALIVTDDVYDFLQWSRTPYAKLTSPDRACVPRLVDVDRYLDGGPQDGWGHAISNGSFSKLIGPGTRTGWAEASEKVAYGLSQTGSTRSGGAPSQLCATIIDQIIPTGALQSHIHKVLRPAYAKRYYTLLEAIHDYLIPQGVTVAAPSSTVAGGYFIWITLPPPLRATEVVRRAQQEESLRLAPGDLFQVPGDATAPGHQFGNSIRLSFSWEEPRHLTEGVRRLARVLVHLTV
ncbi:hypothetical protein NUU61_006262 [Penicillium alfredii]|uniref:Aminotransferase class I/classII large domain-containing protein n=1 Tax=Penicillium alfredii TaxID=1506179 RepID=A0A9W9F0M5_9EURO|nr:uncharacterized protein NUU61_006262 [Penicillium alfredii]KAJ5091392.1 hypothetical protein NUU61_006262 [Penicillium alfredii]